MRKSPRCSISGRGCQRSASIHPNTKRRTPRRVVSGQSRSRCSSQIGLEQPPIDGDEGLQRLSLASCLLGAGQPIERRSGPTLPRTNGPEGQCRRGLSGVRRCVASAGAPRQTRPTAGDWGSRPHDTRTVPASGWYTVTSWPTRSTMGHDKNHDRYRPSAPPTRKETTVRRPPGCGKPSRACYHAQNISRSG